MLAGFEQLMYPLLRGAAMTLFITALSAPLVFVIALSVALARLSRSAVLRVLANVYVEIFRGTSLLVQLFYFFYVVPLLGVTLEPITTGVLVLGLNLGSYGSEIARAALLSVPREQHDACVALGMSPALAMRRIILQQALLIMLPSFSTMLVELLKATSILSLITITELSFTASSLFQTTGNIQTIYIGTLLIYFCMAWALTFSMRRFENRLGVGRHAHFRT